PRVREGSPAADNQLVPGRDETGAGARRTGRPEGAGEEVTMNVGDLMSKPSCFVDSETTLAEETTMMGEQRVGSAPILQGERLTGILTERDIVRAMSTAHDA